jgi:hypothetical protein
MIDDEVDGSAHSAFLTYRDVGGMTGQNTYFSLIVNSSSRPTEPLFIFPVKSKSAPGRCMDCFASAACRFGIEHRNRLWNRYRIGHSCGVLSHEPISVCALGKCKLDRFNRAKQYKSPYVGVDLDHCRDAETGEIEEWRRLSPI